MLDKLGFGLLWRKWVKVLVQTSSLSVEEGLTRLTRKAEERNLFKGVTIAENINFSLLQYEDDVVVVGDISFQNLWKSLLCGINMDPNYMQATQIFLHCKTAPFPFKFLDILVRINPRKKNLGKYY
uniref:Uncharacterized protein n=1 Tax=Cajanus cajan TaxID=3821 RepID=A0A151RBJ7_CAJCA|nr:hypothetical protein KK1_038927 [Cajanus cajan]